MENIKNDNYSKVFFLSIIGIVVFFIPIKINNEYDTILNYIAYFIDNKMSGIIDISIVFFIVLSILKDLTNREEKIFNKTKIIIKIFSFILCISVLMGKEDMFFLDDSFIVILRDLMLDLTILLPVSSLFMPLLLDFGLLEIVEAFTNKFMKKIFKVSGKVFLNFLIYLFVNVECGAFMTYKLYKDGKLREKEAIITILNFSILSLSLTKDLVYKLGINIIKFICIEMMVLFICNFIISRIYPIKNKKQSYYVKSNYKNVNSKRHKIKKAIKIYNENKSNKNLFVLSLSYFNDVIYVLMEIIPTIIFIFFVGNIIYKMPFIINEINNIVYILLEKFNMPNATLISLVINLNIFNNILAIKNIPKCTQEMSNIIMGMFISLQCINISFLIPFIRKCSMDLKIIDIIIVLIERFFLILLICYLIYLFQLKYII